MINPKDVPDDILQQEMEFISEDLLSNSRGKYVEFLSINISEDN